MFVLLCCSFPIKNIFMSYHQVTCISDFWEGGLAVLPKTQSNPMLSVEHSLSPPKPSPTTTWSLTTHQRSISTSLSIFQYEFNSNLHVAFFQMERRRRIFRRLLRNCCLSPIALLSYNSVNCPQHPRFTLHVYPCFVLLYCKQTSPPAPSNTHQDISSTMF